MENVQVLFHSPLPLTFTQNMIYISTAKILNKNFMTNFKTIDFNNRIGSDGIHLPEFQVFKIKIYYYF